MTAVAPAATRAAACPHEQMPALVQQLLIELVRALPGAQSATVTTIRGPSLRPWATSSAGGHDLDHLQAAARTGPAYDAAADRGPVVSANVRADPRWQLPGPADGPPESVVAVAMPGLDAARAVLSVHGRGADLTAPFVVEQITAAIPDLAAAVCVVRARLEVADLQIALTTNRTIGAAIGITMVVRHVSYEAAADLLRSVSNSTNTPLGDLAEAILFTGDIPEPRTKVARRRRPVPPLAAARDRT